MSQTTIVISRSGQDLPDRRDFENGLIEHLAALHPPRVLVIPSIYWLKTPSSALDALRKTRGDLVVAAWLYPRATYWILQQHGISGQFSAQHHVKSVVTKTSRRLIRCLDLKDFASPESCAEALLALSPAPKRKQAKTGLKLIKKAPDERWYPVIDKLACVNCKQCHDFCLFGVYELDEDGRVTAANPDSCRPGCPACARVCPVGAIMFPHYVEDAQIAGTGQAHPPEKTEAPEEEPEHAPGDELDQLIDELDKLDEQDGR